MERIITLLVFIFAGLSARAQARVLVAAASDLRFALDSLQKVFQDDNDGQVQIIYGSSGKLTQQILHGAPFDLFFSADISYPRQLAREGAAASAVYPYAKGRLVLWSRKLDPALAQLKSVLDPGVSKVAIANPAHAPYGQRALECLSYYNLTNAVKPRLVYGENISQTAQFISTGAADMGFIALSLALSPEMKTLGGKYYLIPEESHRPLIQGAIITAHGKGNPLVKSFFDYLKTEEAIAVLRHFGFTKP